MYSEGGDSTGPPDLRGKLIRKIRKAEAGGFWPFILVPTYISVGIGSRC